MKLSAFGEKFAGHSGIAELMEDLGQAMAETPPPLFMGGGNPGRIDVVQEAFAQRIKALLDDSAQRHALLGVYQSPAGDEAFREALADDLRSRYGWPIAADNIAIANGSQSACFVLYNLFAGDFGVQTPRKIHLPITPEYIGYRDIGLREQFFSASPARLERFDNGDFKYHVDFDALTAALDSREIGALSVSRPSNPSGNVVTDDELTKLSAAARDADIPLIVDGAYGQPFPSLIYTEASPLWNHDTVLMLSLSKLGLPGLRTGIVIADTPLVSAFNRANTVLNLACGNLGPQVLAPMLRDGSLQRLCAESITPYYTQRRDLAVRLIREQRGELPVWLHRAEGAFFLWLWCEGLPIDSMELYRRLKDKGVLVLPGNDFFIGVDEREGHSRECLRLSYAGDKVTIESGIAVLMQELRACYG